MEENEELKENGFNFKDMFQVGAGLSSFRSISDIQYKTFKAENCDDQAGVYEKFEVHHGIN